MQWRQPRAARNPRGLEAGMEAGRLKPRMCATSCWMAHSEIAMSRYGWGCSWWCLAPEGPKRGGAREMPIRECGSATRLL